MKAVELALDTGKLRRESSASFVFMGALVAFVVGTIALILFGPGDEPLLARLAVAGCVSVFLVIFLVFFRQQWQRVQRADELLAGSPADVVRGRVALLEVELNAWQGPIARFFELWVAPSLGLLGIAMTVLFALPLWVPVPLILFFIGFSAYGRMNRVPKLRAGIAELEELADHLA